MSGIVCWFSKSGEICLSLQPDIARRIENDVTDRQGKGQIVDPAMVRLRDEIRLALQDAPAGT